MVEPVAQGPPYRMQSTGPVHYLFPGGVVDPLGKMGPSKPHAASEKSRTLDRLLHCFNHIFTFIVNWVLSFYYQLGVIYLF